MEADPGVLPGATGGVSGVLIPSGILNRSNFLILSPAKDLLHVPFPRARSLASLV